MVANSAIIARTISVASSVLGRCGLSMRRAIATSSRQWGPSGQLRRRAPRNCVVALEAGCVLVHHGTVADLQARRTLAGELYGSKPDAHEAEQLQRYEERPRPAWRFLRLHYLAIIVDSVLGHGAIRPLWSPRECGCQRHKKSRGAFAPQYRKIIAQAAEHYAGARQALRLVASARISVK